MLISVETSLPNAVRGVALEVCIKKCSISLLEEEIIFLLSSVMWH